MKRLALAGWPALLAAASSLPAAAETPAPLPVVEAGVFGGGALLPDYPAAGQPHVRGLVLPWLIYRGEPLRSDERGLRGRVWRSRDLEFTLNANGAAGSRSRDNRAREGMPDLDWLGEIGPALRWVAWRSTPGTTRLTLETPLRAVFSTDFCGVTYRGYVLAPELALERSGLVLPRARIGIGPVFASGGLMSPSTRPGRRPEPGPPAGIPAARGSGGP